MKKEMPFLRTQYNYDRDAASDESGLSCPEPTLAKQEFKEESDINFIAERFGLTGEMPEVLLLPSYGDFSGIFDFQTAQNQIVEAQRQFMTLPAKTRARFANDPQQLLEFLASDKEDDRKEAEFLGLVNPRQEAPQSPLGDAKAKGDGDLPPLEPKAEAKPDKSRKDT